MSARWNATGSVNAASPADAVPAGIGDLDLARRVAAGDGAAFELLMRRHNRRLFRIARSVLRDDADAEDALQEAYLAAYRAIESFRGDASLATWLSRLVMNQCLDRRRRDRRREGIAPVVSQEVAALEGLMPAPGTDSFAEAPERSMVRAELRRLLEQKVDALPETFRTVFVMRCIEEMTVEETAQLLSIPEATVRTRHFRARSLLRESLASDVDFAEQELFGFDGARCDRIVASVLSALVVPAVIH